MAKIINVSSEPYEWTFNACNYGPLLPGEVMDLPQEVADHAVKRSTFNDDFGEVAGYKCEFLSNVMQDKEWLKKVAMYPCPFAVTNQCAAKPFKTPDELRAHLESHWGPAASPKK